MRVCEKVIKRERERKKNILNFLHDDEREKVELLSLQFF